MTVKAKISDGVGGGDGLVFVVVVKRSRRSWWLMEVEVVECYCFVGVGGGGGGGGVVTLVGNLALSVCARRVSTHACVVLCPRVKFLP